MLYLEIQSCDLTIHDDGDDGDDKDKETRTRTLNIHGQNVQFIVKTKGGTEHQQGLDSKDIQDRYSI